MARLPNGSKGFEDGGGGLRPCPPEQDVLAMRTAAPLSESTQGWSGIAKTREAGLEVSVRRGVVTRRWKVCLRLFLVMKPKRRVCPALGGAMPPLHDVVGGLRHFAVERAESPGVTVT